jgi:Fe-S-cluster-containing dehydrogenase component
MVIDINRCNGCYNCQIACKDEHVGNDWSPIAKPQPDIGQFWMKVTDVVQGTVPKVRVRYMHDICQHCDEAPCMTACKTKAIYKRDDGIVIIDPEKCTGGRQCLDACPYDAIYFNSDMNIAQKCTFCAHLLDDGWSEPRCVDACPTDALRFGEEADLKEYIDGAELLHPEYGAKPRIYYKGLPNKYFVAGAVFDPEADECLENCTVTLIGSDGKKASLQTDDFGDFWFERLEPGAYSLKVEKDGYLARTIEDIDASQDVNVGDIELYIKV